MDGDARPGGRAERLLWSTRLVLLAAVAGSAVTSVAVLWLTTVDLAVLVGDVVAYTNAADRSSARGEVIATVVKVVDGYLLAAILLVVTFGLYELFISRLDPAEHLPPSGPRFLVVRSLDDLKDRVAKLVVLVLVIELFQRSLKVAVDDAAELALFAGAVALASLGLTLSTLTKRSGGSA